ncbi:AsnC family transcriptional regulator [Streptomonospora litoralis]|uniref:Leucine-responsive transcriptional regulator n=1 Tax=Streptomonospora litoralis TaxID=2498135 RepID=A0A4P6Q1S5_9ACTN|nr:AsnC family transcriptional regulator [Streptomonospora litoralis]QBI53191.1 leucine-responsive transcriptional regulator [Streptomonospora litoralis]
MNAASTLQLDTVDAAIVHELRADGRLAFEALAGRVGLSRAAARLRVRRLLDSGALRVVGVLHPAVRGVGASAHLSIGVRGTAADAAAAVAALPAVASVSVTTGRHPVSAEVRAGDLERLSAAVEGVRALPRVSTAAAAVHTRTLKDPYLGSAPPPRISPDETDRRLLGLLESDGRSSFAEMAGRVGLSAGAVRSRVKRLLESGAVRVTALLDPAAAGMAVHGGFAARLENDADAAAESVAQTDDVRFLARCLGPADAIGTIAAASPTTLHEAFDRLRGLPGVRLTRTWLHLAHVKDYYDA